MGFRKDIEENVDLLQTEYKDLSELIYRLSNRLDNLWICVRVNFIFHFFLHILLKQSGKLNLN